MVGRNKFWKKVEMCHHEINPNYCVSILCDTLFCTGREVHCLKCGVYITHCDCFSNDGMSGWSDKRYNTYLRNRRFDEKRTRTKATAS